MPGIGSRNEGSGSRKGARPVSVNQRRLHAGGTQAGLPVLELGYGDGTGLERSNKDASHSAHGNRVWHAGGSLTRDLPRRASG